MSQWATSAIHQHHWMSAPALSVLGIAQNRAVVYRPEKTGGRMANYDVLADKISAHIGSRLNAVKNTAKGAKAAVIGGSVLLGAAELGAVGHMVGILSVVVVFAAGLLLIIWEQDSVSELDSARLALEATRTKDLELATRSEDTRRAARQASRMLLLYNGMDVMRDAVEGALLGDQMDIAPLIDGLVESAKRPLLLALGFEMHQYWTLCVYIGEPDASNTRKQLRLIAHTRTIMCDIADARVWPEGVGIAGQTYLLGNEIIVPDLSAPDFGTLFQIPEPKLEDSRYRSMVGIPIRLGADGPIWGVVIATSDRPGHFSNDERDGVRPAEGARALAKMVALIVAANDARKKPAGMTNPN